MRRLTGQAGKLLWRIIHLAATVALAIAVLGSAAGIALVWRLSQGPIEMTWLLRRIEAMANAGGGPTVLTIGSAALTWEGYARGFDRPIDLALTSISINDGSGQPRMAIPRAYLSVSIRGLLTGHIIPRAVEIDEASLTLFRAADGALSLDLGSMNETTEGTDSPAPPERGDIMKALGRPISRDDLDHGDNVLSQFQRISIRHGAVTVIDRKLGVTWRAPRADIEFSRRPGGGVDGRATVTLAVGEQTATARLSATLLPGAEVTHVTASLSAVNPANLSRLMSGLPDLRMLDAPVTLTAEADVDTDFVLRSGWINATLTTGTLHLTPTPAAVQGGAVILSGSPDDFRIEQAWMNVAAPGSQMITHLELSGTVKRVADIATISATLGFDQVDFAALPALWPEGASENTRSWIIENIPSGVATAGSVEVGVTVPPVLRDAALTRLSGSLNGSDLTVHWLRPVPPLEQGRAQLRFLDVDKVEINVASARQRGGAKGGLLSASNGRIIITGLSARDQFITIDADVAGTVPNMLGLMREPRLHLFDKQPLDVKDPGGDATVKLAMNFPLEKSLQVEDVGVRVIARATKLRLGGIVAGRDLDQGDVDVEATQTGMTVKGRGAVAGIPLQFDGAIEFQSGPPTQIVRRFNANGRASASQLNQAGIKTADVLAGEISATVTVIERRSGQTEITLDGDLTSATLSVAPLVWTKSAGNPTKGSARMLVVKDQLRQIDRIAIDGTGLLIRGSLDFTNGDLSQVRFDRAVLGRTDIQGSIAIPKDQPIAVRLTGPSLDLSARLGTHKPDGNKRPTQPEAGPPWLADAKLDRVILAGDRIATGVVVTVRNDGRRTNQMAVTGQTSTAAPFDARIEEAQGSRRLTATSSDAGSILRGLNIIKTMEAGVMTVKGTFNDALPDSPLTGSAEINDFRVRGSVGLGRLLQAMTLYGLVDVLSGPGLGFSKLVAPFQLDEETLTLNDARAFSPSLGLTAKGRIDILHDRADVEGTIVPAYFFNSMLGNIPLVGRLFSPETGGGVFAARYTVRGPLEDPAVFVNPLSALTPGFLRELFGLF